MEVELKCPGNVSHVVEIEPTWRVEDLKTAAAEIIGCPAKAAILMIGEEKYGEAEKSVSLESLGMTQGDTVTVQGDAKAMALTRLCSLKVDLSHVGFYHAIKYGSAAIARDYIEADCCVFKPFVMVALESGSPLTALAMLTVPTKPPFKHFDPAALGMALKRGYYDVAAHFFENGRTALPNRFEPCISINSANWELLYKLCADYGVLFGRPPKRLYRTITYLMTTEDLSKLRCLLSYMKGKVPVPMGCVAQALLLSDPAAAELMLQHDIGVSRFAVPMLLKSRHRHLDGKVAGVLKNMHSKMGKSARRATRHLKSASEAGLVEVVDALIEIGGDPSVCLLHCRDVATAESLVKGGGDVNYKGQGTPLVAACRHGEHSLVEYLVQQGAEVNHVAPRRYGTTALIAASKHGNLDIVKYLVEDCGADHLLRTPQGFNAVSAAVAAGHLAVVKYLLKTCPDSTPYPQGVNLIHISAKYGANIHQELSDLTGTSLFETDDLKRNILMHAGMRYNEVPVSLIDKCSAMLSDKCSEGSTALGHAARTGSYNYILYLLRAGCDPNVPLSHGTTENAVDGFLKRSTWDHSVYSELKAFGGIVKGVETVRLLYGLERNVSKDFHVLHDVFAMLDENEIIELCFKLERRCNKLLENSQKQVKVGVTWCSLEEQQPFTRVLVENNDTLDVAFRSYPL